MTRIAQTALTSILLFGIATFQLSCNKQNADTDKEKPIITIAEPIQGDTIVLANDPEIHIEFTATDNQGLHELQVTLIQNQNDTLHFESPSVYNLKVYSYHEHLIPAGIVATTVCNTIIKAVDHNGNIEEKNIQFYIKP